MIHLHSKKKNSHTTHLWYVYITSPLVCYNPQNGLASTTPTWMSQEVSKGIPHLQVGELTPWYQPLILPSNRTSKNPLDIQTKDHAVRSLVHSLTNVRWRSSRLSDASPSPAGPAGPGGSSEATDYHHRNLGVIFEAVGWLVGLDGG